MSSRGPPGDRTGRRTDEPPAGPDRPVSRTAVTTAAPVGHHWTRTVNALETLSLSSLPRRGTPALRRSRPASQAGANPLLGPPAADSESDDDDALMSAFGRLPAAQQNQQQQQQRQGRTVRATTSGRIPAAATPASQTRASARELEESGSSGDGSGAAEPPSEQPPSDSAGPVDGGAVRRAARVSEPPSLAASVRRPQGATSAGTAGRGAGQPAQPVRAGSEERPPGHKQAVVPPLTASLGAGAVREYRRALAKARAASPERFEAEAGGGLTALERARVIAEVTEALRLTDKGLGERGEETVTIRFVPLGQTAEFKPVRLSPARSQTFAAAVGRLGQALKKRLKAAAAEQDLVCYIGNFVPMANQTVGELYDLFASPEERMLEVEYATKQFYG